jgi:dolichol-phosphate mannosyltransferase
MLISLILPVYNESRSLPELFAALIKLVREEAEYDFEFIFVNDGSVDNSLDLLLELVHKDSRFKVLDLSRNFGQQAAFTAGYDYARGEAIITMDSDLQDPPEVISQLLQKWKEGNDIVYARRKSRNDGFLKKITANIYYWLLEKSSDFKLPRNVGDFRLINKKVLAELKKCREKSRYLRGIVAWIGFKYDFVDFERPNRKFGETAYTWRRMFKFAFDGFAGFSMFPLKIAAYLGSLALLISILLFVIGIWDYFVNHNTYPLYRWLVNIIFGFVGLQFLLIWLLGEYIGRIYDQAKDRPLYIVDKKVNFIGTNEDQKK